MRMKLVTSFIILMNNVFNSVQQNNVESANNSNSNRYNQPRWHSNEDDMHCEYKKKRKTKEKRNFFYYTSFSLLKRKWSISFEFFFPRNLLPKLLLFFHLYPCVIWDSDRVYCIQKYTISPVVSIWSSFVSLAFVILILPFIAFSCTFNLPPILLLIVNIPNKTSFRIWKCAVKRWILISEKWVQGHNMREFISFSSCYRLLTATKYNENYETFN